MPVKEMVQTYSEGFQVISDSFKIHSAEIHMRGWAHHDHDAMPAPPRYCYKTLGAADCFTTPQLGQEHRQMAPPVIQYPNFYRVLTDEEPPEALGDGVDDGIYLHQPVIVSPLNG